MPPHPPRASRLASLALAGVLAVLSPFAGCDLLNDEEDEEDELTMTCEGVVEFAMASISATDGVSDVAVVEVAGHGTVTTQTLGTREITPVSVTKGQVLDVTFRFTALNPFRGQAAVLVAAGVSANEQGRIGVQEFRRFTERVQGGPNAFRYAVTAPDFQELQGNGPCRP